MADYQAMCRKRQTMLDTQTEPVFVLADLSELESFSDAAEAPPCDTVVVHPRVRQTLIVIKASLYRSVRSASEAAQLHNSPVLFFPTTDDALAYVERFGPNPG